MISKSLLRRVLAAGRRRFSSSSESDSASNVAPPLTKRSSKKYSQNAFWKPQNVEAEMKAKSIELPSARNHKPLKDIVESEHLWSKSPELRRKWLDELSKFWGFTSLDAWYRVRTEDFFSAPSGRTLINNRFRGSFPKALMDAYPEHPWVYWKFSRLPKALSRDIGLQRAFFHWAGSVLGIDDNNLDRWYSITAVQLEELGGHFVGSIFKSNTSAALAVAYPDHKWIPWHFRVVPRNFWKSSENQREFANWYLSEKLQSKQLESWYSTSTKEIRQYGGHGWLKMHNHSFIVALSHTFPEHVWHEWRFTHVSHNFWSLQSNRRKYFLWLGEQLGFESMADFYRLKIADFDTHHGRGLLYSRYGDRISRAIADSLPDHTWDPEKFRTISG